MTRIDKYIVFSILNAILLVTVIFNTVINLYLFVLIMIIFVIICNILIKKHIINIEKQGKNYFFGVTFPQIINGFFLFRNESYQRNILFQKYDLRSWKCTQPSKREDYLYLFKRKCL